ncbi:MAG: phosphotransferase [Pseudomonadota bacterium]
MTHKHFPASVDELSVEWLQTQLCRTHTQSNVALERFSVEEISGGYTASLYRLQLIYQTPEHVSPKSLVLKVRGPDDTTHTMLDALNTFENEVRFYQTLGKHRDIPVPRCYAAEYDKLSSDFVVLLEDMSAARAGSWDGGAVNDTRIALVHLANIHAAFWRDPVLDENPWMGAPERMIGDSAIALNWKESHALAEKQYCDALSEVCWSVARTWSDNWDDIMRCMAQDSQTLVHTDAHLGQMFFPTKELPRFALFDWQNPNKGWGAIDVVHPLVCELEVNERREHEKSLMDTYYRHLCELGVSDLTRERFAFQCALSVLWIYDMNFKVATDPGFLASIKREADEYGEDWRDWVFAPIEAVTKDWNLPDAVEQAIDEGRSRSRAS